MILRFCLRCNVLSKMQITKIQNMILLISRYTNSGILKIGNRPWNFKYRDHFNKANAISIKEDMFRHAALCLS